MNLLDLDPETLLGTLQYCDIHNVEYKLINDCVQCRSDYCPHCKTKPTKAHFGSHILSCYGMYLTAWNPDKTAQLKYVLINALKLYKEPLWSKEMSDNFKKHQTKKQLWDWCIKMATNFMIDSERDAYIHGELDMRPLETKP